MTADIGLDETSAELEARLASMGAALLVDTLKQLAVGPLVEAPQDEQRVTYAKRLERHESRLDWARPAAAIHNQIRGLQPWPLAAAMLRGRRVLFHRSQIVSDIMDAGEPGTVKAIEPDGLVVATGPGAVRILELQAEGRQPLRAGAFAKGSRITTGVRFDPLPLP